MSQDAITDTAKRPVLQVQNLRTEFRLRSATVVAVDDVSLTVHEGECLGLVGESGCGKSTTGLSIMRLLPRIGHITGGRVLLGDRDLTTLSEAEMRKVRGNDVAMIFQDPMTSLNPTSTIGVQVAEPLRIHFGTHRKAAAKRALEMLDLVGVPNPRERMDDYPHQLSGGLRQRVMIAMALTAQPKLLIADEPTTALDVTIQAQILDLLDRLREELSMAVLLITHDMGVIAGRTDRVMVMYAAKAVESSTTAELFQDTRHPYAKALLESVPQLTASASELLPTIPGQPPDLANLTGGCRFAPRCGHAKPDCSAAEPVLEELEAGHLVACFHPVGSEPEPATDAPDLAAPAPDDHAAQAPEPMADEPAPELPTVVQRVQAVLGITLEPPPPAEPPAAEPPAAEPVAAQATADPVSAPVLVRIERLFKEYPVRRGLGLGFGPPAASVKAVSGISLTIRRGETFGLAGESGCGKTTLGRIVAGHERPTAGTVRIDGREILRLHGAELRRGRRQQQLMFQDPYASLNPRMRVGAIIREPLMVQGSGNRRQQWERVAELLGEIGLSRRAMDLYPHEFSGGQRQRIGLARALALNPGLIVADEPVSALDVSIQSQILNLMKRLQRDHGLTYMVVSHDLSVLRYLSDTIGVMYLGKLVEYGPADDVYDAPAHPYTHGLIQTIPVPDPKIERAKEKAAVRGELPSPVNPPSGCRFRTRCPLAQDLCAQQEPPMQVFGPRHVAACHFPLQQPTTLQPPAGVELAVPDARAGA